jgi:hypothetical protein
VNGWRCETRMLKRSAPIVAGIGRRREPGSSTASASFRATRPATYFWNGSLSSASLLHVPSGMASGNCWRNRDSRLPAEHLREIAEKVRDLARQTPIREVREELFDLADRLDRMADRAKKTPD